MTVLFGLLLIFCFYLFICLFLFWAVLGVKFRTLHIPDKGSISISVRSYFFFFKYTLFLREILDSQQNLNIEWNVQTVPVSTLPPHTCRATHEQHLLPDGYIYYGWWAYIDTSLPPRSIVHNRVHSWCCVLFCGSRQVCNDIYLSL